MDTLLTGLQLKLMKRSGYTWPRTKQNMCIWSHPWRVLCRCSEQWKPMDRRTAMSRLSCKRKEPPQSNTNCCGWIMCGTCWNVSIALEFNIGTHAASWTSTTSIPRCSQVMEGWVFMKISPYFLTFNDYRLYRIWCEYWRADFCSVSMRLTWMRVKWKRLWGWIEARRRRRRPRTCWRDLRQVIGGRWDTRSAEQGNAGRVRGSIPGDGLQQQDDRSLQPHWIWTMGYSIRAIRNTCAAKDERIRWQDEDTWRLWTNERKHQDGPTDMPSESQGTFFLRRRCVLCVPLHVTIRLCHDQDPSGSHIGCDSRGEFDVCLYRSKTLKLRKSCPPMICAIRGVRN